MKHPAVAFVVLATSLAFGYQSREEPVPQLPTTRRIEPFPREAAPPRPPKIDMAQARHDTDELAALTDAVRAQMAELEKGLRPKDLDRNLRRIEKLSKQLRRELQLQ